MRADEGRSAEPQSRIRLAYVGLGVVALLAVVAAASRGHAPAAGAAETHTRAASQILFDIVFTGALLGTICVLFLMAFVRARSPAGGKGSFRSIILIGLGVAVVYLVAIFGAKALQDRSQQQQQQLQRPQIPTATQQQTQRRRKPATPELNWPFAGALLGLLLAAGAIPLYRVLRRRNELAAEVRLVQELAEILDDTLDDLRAEPDPRRAVIAAYARMEQALAVQGLPRHEAEAPLEYLTRILVELTASERSVSRLTDLFERAKFSPHEIGPELKEEAIDALAALRDDLRAVDSVSEPRPARLPAGAPS